MNKDKKDVLSGAFWKFSERMGSQLISFVASIILARLLSPSEYGIIPLVTVFITLSNVLVDSGFGMALIQKKDADDIDFSTVFYFSLFLALLLYSCLFFASVPIAVFYDMEILKPVLRVLAISVIIKAINSVQQAYVARHMIFKKFFYATIIGTITSGIVGIVMAYSGFGVWALVTQTLTNDLMDTIILQITIDWKPIKAFSMKRLKRMFDFGWKLLVQSMVLQIYANLRSLVIGKIYTPADLAFYTKGNQFPDLISTNVDTAINAVLFPAMSNKQDSIESVKEMARKTTRITSYVMNPVLIGFMAVAESLILFVLTDKWLPAVPFLRICCVILLFRAPQSAIIQAVKAVGRSDVVLRMDLPVRLFAIIVLFFSVRYGVMILALSEILVTLVGTVLYLVMSKKVINYSAKEVFMDFGINTLLALMMGGIVYVIGKTSVIGSFATLLLQISSGIVLYFILSIITKNSSFNYILTLVMDIKNRKK